MKKIIGLFIVLFAFSTSNAQEKKASAMSAAKQETATTSYDPMKVKEQAMADISQITELIEISPELKNDLLNLLVMRSEAIAKAKTKEEAKAYFDRYTTKFLGGLSEEQALKLSQKEELYKRLFKFE